MYLSNNEILLVTIAHMYVHVHNMEYIDLSHSSGFSIIFSSVRDI